MLTVTKGFFELLAAKGRAEAAAAGSKGSAGGAGAAAINAIAGGLEDGALEGAGWGEEDLDLGGGGGEEGGGEEGDEEGGWDMEDLEISREVVAAAAAASGGAGTSGGACGVVRAGPRAARNGLGSQTRVAGAHRYGV